MYPYHKITIEGPEGQDSKWEFSAPKGDGFPDKETLTGIQREVTRIYTEMSARPYFSDDELKHLPGLNGVIPINLIPGAQAYRLSIDKTVGHMKSCYSINHYYPYVSFAPSAYLTVKHEIPGRAKFSNCNVEIFTYIDDYPNNVAQSLFVNLDEGLDSNSTHLSLILEGEYKGDIIIEGIDVHKAIEEIDTTFPELHFKDITRGYVKDKTPHRVGASQKQTLRFSRDKLDEGKGDYLVALLRNYAFYGNFEKVLNETVL
ncbi:hypothetical protein HYV12_02045 [Candidatus Dojkabacteria bacterium]|nr:hypothetical protein [Candidatus Dojkabacteria bacterium]